MAVTQETIILGALNGPDGAVLKERRRTSSRGTKSRYTVDIEGDSLMIDLDTLAMGASIADAIRDELSLAIQQIGEEASDSTLKRRKRYAEDGASKSYLARYAGGRTGEKRPGAAQLGTKFNDSGRLAEGLAIRQNPSENAFTINVPANRLTERHFIQELARLVPEISDPRRLLNSPEVLDAIKESMAASVRKLTGIGDLRKNQLWKARWRAFKLAAAGVRAVGGA